MRNRTFFSAAVCALSLLLSGNVFAAPLSLSKPVKNEGGVSASSSANAQYAAAILHLHERISNLEKQNQTQIQLLTAMQRQIAAYQQEINTLKTNESFDRQTLQTLTGRLNYLDGKSALITFPGK